MNELYAPTNSLTHRITPRHKAELRKFDAEGRWNAPYQFTIPNMAAMWLDLQKSWIERKASEWQLQQNDGSTVLKLADKWKRGAKLSWGNLDPALTEETVG
ncbi:MAG: hypothetical protein EXS31_14420 [Pedosphaera sp.]|nr:hypothetical protein [Pedosphaera sp.]